MASLTRLLSADMGSSLLVSASWQMKRSRVSAWRAEPAWMVVKPFTPDDRVSSRGSASRSRTSPTMATSGAMRRKPGDQSAQVDGRAVGSGRPGLHGGHVGQGDVGLEDLLGDDHPLGRVELGRAARQERGLARAGGAGEHDRELGPHAGGEEPGHGRAEHVAGHQFVERAEGHAGEAADVDHQVAAAADVAVHDVQPRPVVELGVLQALGRVELAVAGRRVVEDLGQRPRHVVVVVEDLVVVARRARRGA